MGFKGRNKLMKKTIITLLCATSAIFVFTGCTSFETNRSGEPVKVDITAKAKPEIDLGKDMVTGNASTSSLFGVLTWGVDKEAVGVNYGTTSGSSLFGDPNAMAKNGAAYDACSKSNADILVAPRYNITTNDYIVFKQVNCEVKAFPGKIKSIELQK